MATALSSTASAGLPNRLQALPTELQERVLSHLDSHAITVLHQTCRNLHILSVLQRTLAAYRSPAPVLGRVHLLIIERLDGKIGALEKRLRQIREAHDEHRDPREETAIEGALNTFRGYRLPNDRFSPQVVDLVVGYLQEHSTYRTPPNVIGSEEWHALIGQVPYSPLLPGTEVLLRQSCPLFPDKTIGETHVCIIIPPEVDGKSLTLRRMLDYAENNRGNRIKVSICWEGILQRLGDVPISAGQYILLATCLPNTRGKTHREQLAVLSEHREYREAPLSVLLVAALMEYIRSGGAKTHLFESEFARTSTKVDRHRLVFGGFGWPSVFFSFDDAHVDVVLGLAVVYQGVGGSSVPGL